MNRGNKTEEVLKEFRRLAKEPLRTAAEHAAGTKGVIAIAGMYMPEELIHAAGFLPMILLEQNDPVTAANAHVQSFMCGYVRSMMDQVLLGKLDFTKALFIKDCCHEIRMIGDLMRWKEEVKANIEFFFFPVTIKKPESQEYIRQEVRRIRAAAESLAKALVTDEQILESIRIYNENRALLKELYTLRRENPGIISGLDITAVIRTGMSIRKEEHSEMLKKLLGALRSDLEDGSLQAKAGPGVILTGSLCESCEDSVIQAVEEAGGIILDDDLYVGGRYFNTMTAGDEDPAEALAEAYIYRNSPCPTQFDGETVRSEYLAKMADRAGAKGIIEVVVKFCEAHYFSNLSVQTDMRKMKRKLFTIYTDHDQTAEGQISTRIQSFLENM